MNKQYYKSNLATTKYLQNTISFVINEIGNLMEVCYGPYGSHVLISNSTGVEAMKDGQRILSSYIADTGIAKSVREALRSVSDKQAEEIGDGTTTTILLLRELYKRFTELINKKHISPSVFNKKLANVVDEILKNIKTYSKDVVVTDENGTKVDWDLLRKAIYTSVDANVELTDVICDMFKELESTNPLVIFDTSTTESHRYELVKGIELDGSPISPEIFFNGYSRKECSNSTIVVVNGRLDLNVESILNIDNTGISAEKDFIFLCTGVNEETLNTLVTIKKTNPALMNHITFFQIRTTASNTEFMDICAALGATPIDSETFTKVSSNAALMKLIDVNSGSAEKTSITEFCIRFNNPKSDPDRVQERINEINTIIEELNNDPSSHNMHIKDLESRKAFLSKNYAKLYIGGSSPQRRSINYELAKDGVLQAISCMNNGVVDGCNVLVPNIISNMKDFQDEICNDIKFAILNSYIELFAILIKNKIGDHDEAMDMIFNHMPVNGYVPINLRDDDDVDVLNSAATDKTILRNATDMAALLATSKAYLSAIPEFDSVNNQ